MRLRSGDKHHLRKSADRKAQISSVSGIYRVIMSKYASEYDVSKDRLGSGGGASLSS